MNNKITYSFIIPHHNTPDLLQRCLESIPQRSDIEIIVVDDNSELNKQPIINREDVKIIYIDKDNSRGAGHARNVALTTAKGKWLLFADCDDFYNDGFINVLDRYKDNNSDIVFFDVHYGYDIITKCEYKSPLSRYIKEYINETTVINKNKLIHSVNAPWCKMVSNMFISAIGARFHETPVCNDAWFSHYIAVNATTIDVICEKLYYWVKNEHSTTHSLNYERELIRAREECLIRKYLTDNHLGYINAPLWKNTKWQFQQLGLLKTIQLLLYKIWLVYFESYYHKIWKG